MAHNHPAANWLLALDAGANREAGGWRRSGQPRTKGSEGKEGGLSEERGETVRLSHCQTQPGDYNGKSHHSPHTMHTNSSSDVSDNYKNIRCSL